MKMASVEGQDHDVKQTSRGYQKLAFLMGIQPEIAIFRKFGWLSTYNLMKLQAQLIHKEDELRRCQRKDELDEKDEKYGYSTSFETLLGSGKNSKQLFLLEESARLLREYSELPFKMNLTSWKLI
jgi:hypothetical protein